MKDNRTITMGYDEEKDKFVLVTDDFDSMEDMSRAVNDISHHLQELVKDGRTAAEFKGGTVCPQCGLRQAHIHLGWLDLGEFKEDDGAVFTYLHCDDPKKGCGYESLIVRFQPEYKGGKKGEIQDAVWNLFGGFPGNTVCPGGVG